MDTKHKPLFIVAGVCAVLVIVAVASRSGSAPTQSDTGPLLPGLESRVGDAAKIVITRGPDEVVIEKSAGDDGATAWIVPSAGGYPADLDKLRPFIAALTEAKIVESKTKDPAKFADLGLTDPAPDGSSRATRAQILGPDGNTIADVLFGDADPAGVPGRSFVRLEGQDQTYLADAPNPPIPDIREWVNTEVARIAIGRVRAVTVARPGDEPVTIGRESMTGDWDLLSPAGETLENGAGRRLGGALAYLNWTSALPSVEMGENPIVTTYDLFDGTRIVITKHAEQPLLTARAEYDESARLENDDTADRLVDVETVRQRVDEFNRRHDGWVYTVTAGAASAIAPIRSEILVTAEPEGPAVEVPDAPMEDPIEPFEPDSAESTDESPEGNG